MSNSNHISCLINHAKPVLKKIVPKSVRQIGKKVYLSTVREEIIRQEILPYDTTNYPFGVNLIGPYESPTGLGQSFRLLLGVIAQTEIPYKIYNYDPAEKNSTQNASHSKEFKRDLLYSINIWHVNPADFAEVYLSFGKECFDRRYNIAYWLWELEEFPREWVTYIHLLNEIWTPSEFISRGIRKVTPKTVRTIPYHVPVPVTDNRFNRACFGLPDQCFLFLMMYDARSVRERKNPEGAIRAFQKAFAPDDRKVGLVIKVSSANPRERRLLESLIGEYRNIHVYEATLERIQVNSLIACMDCFVSLHRAEGFGLVMAESMLSHIPVIATDWSANTEFMDPESTCMVGYKLTTLDQSVPPYKKGSRWAEPDVEEAAVYMKRLVSDRAYYRKKAESGYLKVRDELGMDTAISVMKTALNKLSGSDDTE